MSFLLVLLGLVTAAAGAGMIIFGIPINEFGLGNTLIMAGVVAVTGGFVILALAAVVSQVAHLGEDLADLAMRRVPSAPVTPSAPDMAAASRGPRPRPYVPPAPSAAPEAVAAVAEPSSRPSGPTEEEAKSVVSAAAIDRLRASLPRVERAPLPDARPAKPSGGEEGEPARTGKDEAEETSATPAGTPVSDPATTAAGDAAADDVSVAAGMERAGAEPPAEAPKSSPPSHRPDPTTERPAAPARTAQSRFDFPWRSTRPRADDAPATPAAPPPAAKPAAPSLAATAETPAAAPAVLKSGVVDGMAYTLFTDGSIEAKLPEGTMRFATIAELRTYLEGQDSQGNGGASA